MPARGEAVKAPPRPNRCLCPICRSGVDHPDKTLHQQINLLMSSMDHRQRRLFAAFLAGQWGRGGIARVMQITGMDRKTIRRGIEEISEHGE